MISGRELAAARALPDLSDLADQLNDPQPSPREAPDGAGAEAGSAAGGVAFIATLRGMPGRDIIDHGLTALRNLDHRRGGPGGGAGVLTQIPDALMRDVTVADLPRAGHYAVGMCFLPADEERAGRVRASIDLLAGEEGLSVLTWRPVPTRPDVAAGPVAATMPSVWQLFVRLAQPASQPEHGDPEALQRQVYRLRKRSEHATDAYFASFSARTILYKALVGAGDLERFYPDLSDPRFASEIAVVHSRAAQSESLDWAHAHPFRVAAHDGTITSINANRSWVAARAHAFAAEGLGDVADLGPICSPQESPAASFDELLELLHVSGRSLPHAVLMMLPEAWEHHAGMDPHHRAFYQYYATMLESWDGPAAVCFTDGRFVGATGDRHGLRAGRYVLTEDGLVVLASEVGVLDIDPSRIARKGRLAPGTIFLVDTGIGQILEDRAIKSPLAERYPYSEWLEANLRPLEPEPGARTAAEPDSRELARWHHLFGYRGEEIQALLVPTAMTGIAPIGPAVAAAAGTRPRLLFDYFCEPRPQVTQAPIDAVREEVVSSLAAAIGPEANLLADGPEHARKVVVRGPAIANDELAMLAAMDGRDGGFTTRRISATVDPARGASALRARLAQILAEVDAAVADGVDFLLLSDRVAPGSARSPIPSLLVTSAVHSHLGRTGDRARVSLVVEAGDVRDVHQLARLIDYGAACVNPYVAISTVVHRVRTGALAGIHPEVAVQNLLGGLGRGLLQVMGAHGISALGAYRGSRLCHTLGLDHDLVAEFFPGTASMVGGVGLERIVADLPRGRAGTVDPPVAPARPLQDLLDLRADAPPRPRGRSDGALDRVESAESVESVEAIRARLHVHSSTHRPVDVTVSRYALTAAAVAAASVLRLAPPPHHDVTGTDDLAQLVRDLRRAAPAARIWVQLLTEPTMGSYVPGIVDSHADAIVVSAEAEAVAGAARGRGDLLDDLHRRGLPWELGLLATRRRLDRAGDRTVRLVADADLRDGHDVVVAALLGAEEFVLAPEADPEAVAAEVRELLGRLGARGLAGIVGRGEFLDTSRAVSEWAGHGLDLSDLLAPTPGQPAGPSSPAAHPDTPDGPPEPFERPSALEEALARGARTALTGGGAVRLEARIDSADASIGTRLGAEVTRRYGPVGLPAGTVTVDLRGTAGQSLGAFLPAGVTLSVVGDANDYVAKGLSGGRVIVRPDRASVFASGANVIAGNAVAYGASSGSVFLGGTVGERFGLRNDGATLICEGAGDHACEFMSGGTVLILGPTGWNLGAGMSGGVAYVLDLEEELLHRARGGQLRTGGVDEFDVRALTVLLAEHAEVTDSRIATALLSNPDDIETRFTRVQPRAIDTGAGPRSERVSHVTNAWERIIARRWH
ncbi:hypothetical protein GCG21_07895 [Pseudactinotalea sp. HY160]|uniref:GltB/FmdC/FwdC-like GXGXG domain-containing protein n=1 Tax=Pseudactinotalea sp. HY160 TaxID=2654490 RepID=UPI00128D28D6|nr:glutamate synthase central domain-containing protein [Pseudactinotalea sp. HY160]MPV49927.1 hypothetical protein [Pseudactinotalea sp. HY160]